MEDLIGGRPSSPRQQDATDCPHTQLRNQVNMGIPEDELLCYGVISRGPGFIALLKIMNNELNSLQLSDMISIEHLH